ncbi:hypothetical protein LJC56_11750, partial [Christensenellaceae bacterium OttesenSCG-928-K19]|nr:hypothetical protein [Christensenellaceae bacterium OttesenSCG-928-K19]
QKQQAQNSPFLDPKGTAINQAQMQQQMNSGSITSPKKNVPRVSGYDDVFSYLADSQNKNKKIDAKAMQDRTVIFANGNVIDLSDPKNKQAILKLQYYLNVPKTGYIDETTLRKLEAAAVKAEKEGSVWNFTQKDFNDIVIPNR